MKPSNNTEVLKAKTWIPDTSRPSIAHIEMLAVEYAKHEAQCIYGIAHGADKEVIATNAEGAKVALQNLRDAIARLYA